MLSTYSLNGARVVTPDGPIDNLPVAVEGKRLSRIGSLSGKNLELGAEYTLYPAFINVHDHLRGDYLPKVGPPEETYYLRCVDWISDLNTSEVYVERGKLTEEDCYSLGGYKNLFSGVVTVNDHYPHALNEKYIPDLPVRVIQNYTLHHEVSSHSLDWGDGIEAEHNEALEKNYPFIVHLEEGFDEDYQRGVDVLSDLNCLDEHCVLIHCLGFSDSDIETVAKAGSTVVWCPASNFFMFNTTCKVKKIMERGINVALGTDSTHTGSINLLEEMRFARRVYKKLYREELPPRVLYEMVTSAPARAFRMESEVGSLEEGKLADLLLLNKGAEDPYGAVVDMEIEDIALLIWEGIPIYGDREYRDFFELDKQQFADIVIRGQEKFVKGDPAGLLKDVRKKVGFEKALEYMPLD